PMFFFNDTATTETYTLSLHDALPIWSATTPENVARIQATYDAGIPIYLAEFSGWQSGDDCPSVATDVPVLLAKLQELGLGWFARSEEHTSELQSRENLVCRLLLEKKK